jgi:hypothetical protein
MPEPRRPLTPRTKPVPPAIVLRGDEPVRAGTTISVGEQYPRLAEWYGRADETERRLKKILHWVHVVERPGPQPEDDIESLLELVIRTAGKGLHILGLVLAIAAAVIWQRIKMAVGAH